MQNRHLPPWVTALIVLLGLGCVVIGVVYLAEPARSLPAFFPGHQAGVARHHYKHGIAAILVGIALFAGAWFSTGTKDSATA